MIERARGGAEHPLEALDYSGKTEEHGVCSAVLSFVRRGKEGPGGACAFLRPALRMADGTPSTPPSSVSSGPGHLRGTLNGVAVQPRQLDQAKVPTVDFRAEHATVDAKQRLKLRKLFQDAGVACKPNEESDAAGRMLSHLRDLARGAGGDPPLPERPDTHHLTELEMLAGNEQLLGRSRPARRA